MASFEALIARILGTVFTVSGGHHYSSRRALVRLATDEAGRSLVPPFSGGSRLVSFLSSRGYVSWPVSEAHDTPGESTLPVSTHEPGSSEEPAPPE